MFKTKKTTCMEQEILAQAEIIEHALNKYVENKENIKIDLPDGIKRVIFVASGSSYHCSRFGAELFGIIAKLNARAIYSSEFLLKSVIPVANDVLYIFITQSGETTDTNKALVRAKEAGVKTLCITNDEESTIWKAADYKVACHAGIEKSIAATKSVTTTMMCIVLLAIKLAKMQGIDTENYMNELLSVPKYISETYKLQPKIKQLAKFVSKYKHVVFCADGISYALAKEACLKMKETSYVNSTASILGEFMHGHVAVFNHKAMLFYILADDLSYTATKNLNKIKEDYNPPICILGNKNDKIKSTFNLNVDCEGAIPKYFCIIVMVQLLALMLATRLHRNVDEPHGLTKVVK